MRLGAISLFALYAFTCVSVASADELEFRAHVGDGILRPAGMWKLEDISPNKDDARAKELCGDILGRINESFQVHDSTDPLSSHLRILTENGSSAPWVKVDQGHVKSSWRYTSYFKYDDSPSPRYVYRVITMLSGNASYLFPVTDRLLPGGSALSHELAMYPVIGGMPPFTKMFPKVFQPFGSAGTEDLMVLPNKALIDLRLLEDRKSIKLFAAPVDMPLRTVSLKASSSSPHPEFFSSASTACVYSPTMRIDWY